MSSPTPGLVVGFLFDPAFKYVVLIKKNKPPWMAGKYNGVGGKMELGESPYRAMVREFKEETGLLCDDFFEFAHLSGPDKEVFSLHCFWGKSDRIHEVRTVEEEVVNILDVRAVLEGEFKTLGNIPWLVAMARAVATGADGCALFQIEEREYKERA